MRACVWCSVDHDHSALALCLLQSRIAAALHAGSRRQSGPLPGRRTAELQSFSLLVLHRELPPLVADPARTLSVLLGIVYHRRGTAQRRCFRFCGDPAVLSAADDS